MTDPTPAHTPEPQLYEIIGKHSGSRSQREWWEEIYWLYPETGMGTGTLILLSNTQDVGKIDACVNACAGMSDPAAEIAALREKAAKWDAQFVATNPVWDAGADARDAERYRKLRQHTVKYNCIVPSDWMSGNQLDAAIDAIGGSQ